MDTITSLSETLYESVDLHRLWAGMVNEILACRLTNVGEWRVADAHAEHVFHHAIARIQASGEHSRDLARIQALKLQAHSLARQLIFDMQATGHVNLESYREFIDAHTSFLKGARDFERQLWMSYANEDVLTGLLNRNTMDGLLALEWQKAANTGYPCLLVIADIDHFKQVNDTYGHLVGDSVLRAVSMVLRENVRLIDMVFRYGGEEFLICLPGLSMAAAVKNFELIRKRIANHKVNIAEGGAIVVTVSFGISELMGARSIADSIAAADAALYRAKAAGRNRVMCEPPHKKDRDALPHDDQGKYFK